MSKPSSQNTSADFPYYAVCEPSIPLGSSRGRENVQCRADFSHLVSRPQQSNAHPGSSVQVPCLVALPGLPTSHLAGVVTETPPQGGKGRLGPQEGLGQLLPSGGGAGLCRGAARKAAKSWQWLGSTRKRGRSITKQTSDVVFSRGGS